MSYSLRPHGLYSPWKFPDQNTGVGSLSLLQKIFPTQESNPGCLHFKQIFYSPSHQGSPCIVKKHIFKSFSYFLNWVVFLSLSSLYTLDTRTLEDKQFASIFSHFQDCPFTFLIGSFDAQKLLPLPNSRS